MNDSTPVSRPKGRDSAPNSERAKAVSHIIFNIALLAIAIMMFNNAGALPSSAWEPIGSGSFPRLMLAILAILNVMMVIKEIHKLRHTTALASGSIKAWLWQHRLSFGVLSLFAFYTFALPLIGFRWATLPFVLACQFLLGTRRPKQIVIAVIIAFLMSFGLDALFRHIFTISLPSGSLL